jgi:hypothetical protein
LARVAFVETARFLSGHLSSPVNTELTHYDQLSFLAIWRRETMLVPISEPSQN